MAALSDDLAIFKDGDFIGVFGDGQAMGNREDGATGGAGPEVSQDFRFRPGIEHRCRLVEEVHERISGHGPSDGDSLMLVG